jgi:hypothetical protein
MKKQPATMSPAETTAFMEAHFDGHFIGTTLREARDALRDKGLLLKYASMVLNFHPFAVQGVGRKSVTSTPDWLTPSDWETLTELVKCQTPEDFQTFAFSTLATKRAVFWRIMGWPEGMAYCHPGMEGSLNMCATALSSPTWQAVQDAARRYTTATTTV